MIRYRLTKGKDMRKGADPKAEAVSAQLVTAGRVSFRALCEEVAEQSSLTTGDVKNCIDRLVFTIKNHLSNGMGVDCGDLGSFRVTVRSNQVSTEKEFDAVRHMKPLGVVFTPGADLQSMKKTVRYERVADVPAAPTPGGGDGSL